MSESGHVVEELSYAKDWQAATVEGPVWPQARFPEPFGGVDLYLAAVTVRHVFAFAEPWSSACRQRPSLLGRVTQASIFLIVLMVFLPTWLAPAFADQPSGDAWLRDQLLKPPDAPGYAVTADYQVPFEEVIPGGGKFFETVRAQSLRAARLRSFQAFNGSAQISVRLVEYASHLTSDAVAARAEGPLVVLPDQDVPTATVITRQKADADETKVHVGFAHGRVSAELIISVYGPGVGSSAVVSPEVAKVIVQFVAIQASLLSAAPDLPGSESISLEREKRTLFGALVAALIAIQIVAALIAIARDPAARRRSAAGQSQTLTDRFIDVTSIVKQRRRRAYLGVVIRNVVFIGVLLMRFSSTTLVQLAWLSLAAITFTGAEMLVARRRQRTSFRAPIGIGAIAVRLLASGVAVALGAAGAFLIFISLVPLSTALAPDFSAPLQRTLAAFSILVGVIVVGLGGLAAKGGATLAANRAKNLLQHDRRPAILFLRSFMDERLKIRSHRTGRHTLIERLVMSRFERFEEILSWQIWRYGPAIAFAQPGQKLVPLGAARLWAANDNWVQVVDELIGSSRFVVLSLGRTPAVLFEIQRIMAAGALNRTIFVLPPVAEQEQQLRLAVAAAALKLDSGLLRHQVADRHVLGFFFDASGQVITLVADRRDDLAFQVTLDAMAGEVAVQSGTRLYSPAQTALANATIEHSAIVVPHSVGAGSNGVWRRRLAAATVAVMLPCGVIGLLGYQFIATGIENAPAPLPGRVIAERSTTAFDIDAGSLAVWDSAARSIALIDSNGDAATLPPIDGFIRDVLLQDDMVYVATAGPNRVVALTTGGATRWTAELEAAPGAITSIAGRLAASLPAVDKLVVLDLRSGVQLGTTKPGRGPHHLANGDSAILVTNSTDSTVVWIDIDSLEIRKTQKVFGASVIIREGRDVFVMSILDSSVTVLDYSSGDIQRVVLVARPSLIAIVGENIAVATYEKRPRILFLNRRTLETVRSVAVPSSVAAMDQADGVLVCSIPSASVIVTVPFDKPISTTR